MRKYGDYRPRSNVPKPYAAVVACGDDLPAVRMKSQATHPPWVPQLSGDLSSDHINDSDDAGKGIARKESPIRAEFAVISVGFKVQKLLIRLWRKFSDVDPGAPLDRNKVRAGGAYFRQRDLSLKAQRLNEWDPRDRVPKPDRVVARSGDHQRVVRA